MENNRYLIYQLKNKEIQASIPKRFGGFKIHGRVNQVYRDVITGKISISLGRETYHFREPRDILHEDNAIVFAYGAPHAKISDKQLLTKIKDATRTGGYLDEVLKTLGDEEDAILIHFEIVEPIKS